jgi:OFA family oxalate/formate antiporter-like MFS transporter
MNVKTRASFFGHVLHSTYLSDRFPFFYGWLMLPVAMLAFMATSPGQTFGVSIFNNSFREAIGLSHSQLTGAYMAGTLLASLPQSYIGAIMDRFGIRRTMTIVVFLFGSVCILASQVSSLLTLFLVFLFLRMLGQGALSLMSINTLAMWFDVRLGTVSGIMSAGMAGAVAIAPALILWLINTFAWRWAYAILGFGVWILILPLLLFVYRNRPEDIGQHSDGIAPGVDRKNDVSTQYQYMLREALRTRAYWILTATFAIWAMIATGITFNIVPLLETRGLTATDAAATFTTTAIALAIFQFTGGWLADRLPLNILASISMAALSASVWVLMRAETVLLAHTYAALLGMGQGLLGAVGNTIWMRYYGRTNLGKIRGSTWTAVVAGSSMGPFIMGATFDLFKSYTHSLWLFLGLYAPLILITLLATQPENRKQADAQ